MGTASAFAPGHLTGLFQICDQPEDPLLKGARGSGVSLDLGVYTAVRAEDAKSTTWSVTINGKAIDAPVSESVLSKFRRHLPGPMSIKVEHTVETPMTAGFGASGGGALGLALALNKATEAGLTRLEAASIAHVAEIECRTGLGSVFAAERGGFGILTEPGAPGIGRSLTYSGQESLRVVYLYYAPISTKEALSDPTLRVKINELGGKFVDELRADPKPELFVSLSRSFTEHVGLVTPRLRSLFDATDRAGFTFTMAMFGETAFTVVEKEKSEEAAAAVEKAAPDHEAVVVGIDSEGARLEG
jgi:pantoate kinase